MIENLFNRSFAAILVMMFFICAAFYNIGYFGTLGDSLWYFFYVPTTIFDIIKTGFLMLIPLFFLLMIFKPILVNPAFNGNFPGANILLAMAVLVLVSNLLYFTVFIDSPNRSSALISESAFYIFSLVCFIAIIYYFLSDLDQKSLMSVFLSSLLPMAFIIGVIDAKIDINSSLKGAKSHILLKNDQVVSANILRSFDRGMFLMINSTSSINFVSWDEIKEVKFKKVSSF